MNDRRFTIVKDPNTEDLPIPNILEQINKRVCQMKLSHKEIISLIDTCNIDVCSDMIVFKGMVTYYFDRFLDLSVDHYVLRKRLFSLNPPCYLDFAHNNFGISETFLNINEYISKYDLARSRIKLSV